MKDVVNEYSEKEKKPFYTKPKVVITYTKEALKEQFKELKGATLTWG